MQLVLTTSLFREVFLWIKFWFLPTFDLFFVSFPFQNGTRRENGFYVKYVHLSVFFLHGKPRVKLLLSKKKNDYVNFVPKNP